MTADVDGVDDEVAAVECLAAVELGLHLHRATVVRRGEQSDAPGEFEAPWVDVVHDEFERSAVEQVGGLHEVADELAGELGRSGADEADPGHARSMTEIPSIEQYRAVSVIGCGHRAR